MLDCNLYIDVRRRWKEKLALVNVDVYNVMRQRMIVLKEKLCGI